MSRQYRALAVNRREALYIAHPVSRELVLHRRPTLRTPVEVDADLMRENVIDGHAPMFARGGAYVHP